MTEFQSDHRTFYFNDLTPIEVQVRYQNKSYVLREASEGAAVRYQNAIFRSTKMGKDGQPASIEGLADADPLLLSLCLFECYEHQGKTLERPVDEKTIRTWPSRVIKPLIERLKKISKLDDEPQKVLEKRFEETAESLVKLSSSDRDRDAWQMWMQSVIGRVLGTAPSDGSIEEQVKNSQSATTTTSV